MRQGKPLNPVIPAHPTMAIYHCNVQIISRSHGRSAVAAAAYRSRSKLRDERYGKTHDYSKKDGLSHDEILLPDGADERLRNRQELWAEVERKETRSNSQLAREFIVALPKELSDEENITLTRRFAKEEFVKRGMITDICIHDLGKQTPHAHIMLTMRKADENGLLNEKKSAREWNKKDLLIKQRAAWSQHVNQALEQAALKARVDHRSWKDKGIEHEPKIHLGWYAHNLEQQGIASELGDINRRIDEYNKLLKRQRQLEQKIQKAKREAQAERVARQAAKQQSPPRKPTTDKELISQLLDQQRDRERGKLWKENTATKASDQSRNTLNQQIQNLNNAITEFSASVEKLNKTQQNQSPVPKQKPREKPRPKRPLEEKNQERER